MRSFIGAIAIILLSTGVAFAGPAYRWQFLPLCDVLQVRLELMPGGDVVQVNGWDEDTCDGNTPHLRGTATGTAFYTPETNTITMGLTHIFPSTFEPTHVGIQFNLDTLNGMWQDEIGDHGTFQFLGMVP